MQKINKKHPIILASNSPQRKRLLEEFAISFTVIPANITENINENWTPKQAVIELSRQKAENVIQQHQILLQQRKFFAVLSADTIVVLNNKILGKPKNNNEAYEMIWNLSRSKHQVVTGVCIYSLANGYCCDCFVTDIEMEPMSQQKIQDYINTNNVLERAGAIDIENIQNIRKIDGDLHNVIGLPVKQILKKWFV
ncbi:nucleoside triphosphate pyrophosphatase [Candidatus Uabimicrobium sp. HlEnr_7]|uniref:Maf family protein n=1 Tax=Candidatus Uabimicrobium helgolandensis TaxID=3095367 RepID=UPI0035587657